MNLRGGSFWAIRVASLAIMTSGIMFFPNIVKGCDYVSEPAALLVRQVGLDRNVDVFSDDVPLPLEIARLFGPKATKDRIWFIKKLETEIDRISGYARPYGPRHREGYHCLANYIKAYEYVIKATCGGSGSVGQAQLKKELERCTRYGCLLESVRKKLREDMAKEELERLERLDREKSELWKSRLEWIDRAEVVGKRKINENVEVVQLKIEPQGNPNSEQSFSNVCAVMRALQAKDKGGFRAELKKMKEILDPILPQNETELAHFSFDDCVIESELLHGLEYDLVAMVSKALDCASIPSDNFYEIASSLLHNRDFVAGFVFGEHDHCKWKYGIGWNKYVYGKSGEEYSYTSKMDPWTGMIVYKAGDSIRYILVDVQNNNICDGVGVAKLIEAIEDPVKTAIFGDTKIMLNEFGRNTLRSSLWRFTNLCLDLLKPKKESILSDQDLCGIDEQIVELQDGMDRLYELVGSLDLDLEHPLIFGLNKFINVVSTKISDGEIPTLGEIIDARYICEDQNDIGLDLAEIGKETFGGDFGIVDFREFLCGEGDNEA